MKFGPRLTVYRGCRFRLVPEWGISRRSAFFCGGFHLYWFWFAAEYDHLSPAWRRGRGH